jgi:hypothetical protein
MDGHDRGVFESRGYQSLSEESDLGKSVSVMEFLDRNCTAHFSVDCFENSTDAASPVFTYNLVTLTLTKSERCRKSRV